MASFAIPGMLLFGTSTVVISKLLFSMTAPINAEGDVKKFQKPWFQTDAMFAGMLLCLFAHWITQALKSKAPPEQDKLISKRQPVYGTSGRKPQEEEEEGTDVKTYFLVGIPAVCDLIATVLGNIGLQWINASIWQMLRGAMVVFSAVLSIIFLNRRFYLFNWIGIGLVIAALALVGVSCINAPPAPGQSEEGSDKMVFGIILVLAAQLVQASQIVLEEFLLKSVKAPPLLIVGMEGFWGLILTSFICLPLFQHWNAPGFSENSMETFYMLGHSPKLIGFASAYIIVILLYNATAMMVTQQFTAVHRTILEAMRTLCIWVVNLFIYYEVTPQFGEHWSVWSWFELLGFGVLLIGMFIYNEVLELSFLPDYGKLQKAEHAPDSAKAIDPESGRKLLKPPMSPFATRSPRI